MERFDIWEGCWILTILSGHCLSRGLSSSESIQSVVKYVCITKFASILVHL